MLRCPRQLSEIPIYLSADNAWDIGDVLIGRVDHVGELAGGASYTGTLIAKLPPLKQYIGVTH